MVEWHMPDLDPEDIQRIIREGRDKDNNTTFNSLSEYSEYIYKDNERILNEYVNHTKPKIDPQSIADMIREDRDERDAHLESIIMESIEKNKGILDKLGSDYDENGVPYWDKWTSKQIGDDFEMQVLKDLENRGFQFISRNVHMKGTGCEVDFLARMSDCRTDLTWHVEAKGGKPGDGKRPGAKRTDNVKKAVANAALIKALYPDIFFVAYFSSRPKLKTYSREMIDTARYAKLFDEVIYLEQG